MLFSKGRTDDKLRIIFDMCDNDKNGSIDKAELSELLNSLVDIAKTQKLSEKDVDSLINRYDQLLPGVKSSYQL